MKELLEAIARDVKDIFAYGIETTKTNVVPSRHDDGLTFQVGADKKGKTIETCVLFIDIRNSTGLSRRFSGDKVRLGKIYEAFIYAMAWIADEYGYVRNIVGDRVMVVFEPANCFNDAINCAALMYTAATKILKPLSELGDTFKVGIGIEHGELLVLKAGIQKRNEERSEYKGLVWVGNAANIASKLTDAANKEYSAPQFHITYNELVKERVLKGYTNPFLISQNPLSFTPRQPIYEQEWITKHCSTVLSDDRFIKEVEFSLEGIKYNRLSVTSISKTNNSGTASPILMSGKVYNEYKKTNMESPFLKFLELKKYPHTPYTGTEVYGGYLILSESSQLKLK